MKLLVTGSAGRIGHRVVAALADAGHDVDGFDLVTGDDVRDVAAVRAAVRGVDGVVHLAAIPHDTEDDPANLMATNVTGTSNLLSAAAGSGVRRFVYASSVNALGVFQGLRTPDYLPIDDDHPCYGTSPYGVSKLLGEELCALTSRTTALSTICLRIPWVVAPGEYSAHAARYAENHAWEYGAFIDVRDLARAIVRSVEIPFEGHERVLVGSADAIGATPPVDVADRLFPGMSWTTRAEFEADRRRPLVRTDRARALLGWAPVHTWSANVVEPPSPRSRSLPSRVGRRVRTAWRTRR